MKKGFDTRVVNVHLPVEVWNKLDDYGFDFVKNTTLYFFDIYLKIIATELEVERSTK